ncbi:nitroreductase family deazaflavin-dependent oxidoreductase [Isoptericola variabilis]|uniref:Nitroreductase n=1 Tax=Isoptericola variabilis (strain 225) TaxID=743718 RepID=F6FUY2_ISOV2|nr:nitroreductase family deazaflavin-dependent oxidoreductase [Isoptericola variabilis]AEG44322.1 hypothetical protein Isova_1569 [Isoptericola variabilis 225]TWH31090.1 deazaflavin-dependent oxidoreductase (nitroreductase family) [Isoptericola variabilis J7]
MIAVAQQTTSRRAPGTPGALSRWVQHKANARTIRRLRTRGGRQMGMDLLVLHTVGRRSGEPRQTPLAWFDDGDGAWLVVASGGCSRHPDWFANLVARPDDVRVELHGTERVPVTPHVLDDAARAVVWPRIAAAAPHIDKHQRRSARTHPVVRLARR